MISLDAGESKAKGNSRSFASHVPRPAIETRLGGSAKLAMQLVDHWDKLGLMSEHAHPEIEGNGLPFQALKSRPLMPQGSRSEVLFNDVRAILS
jgi:hypothetical protein